VGVSEKHIAHSFIVGSAHDLPIRPASVDIVIPGNDDALKSVRLMIEQLVSSVEEGSANHRESVASMGSAEKRDEMFAPGDEPRPTRGQRLPEGMATRLTPGSKASAAVLDAAEGEEGSTARSVAKFADEESI